MKKNTISKLRLLLFAMLFIFMFLLLTSIVTAQDEVAIMLDGVDGEVVVKDSYYLDGYSESTWNMWVKQHEYVDRAGLFGKYMTGEDNRAYIIRTVLNHSISFVVSSEGVDTALATSISKKRCGIRNNDEWTMLSIVFNKTHVLYYHNGVLCDTDKLNISTIHNSPKTLRFGGANNRFFNGEIDDFRIYALALSDSQLKALYSTRVYGISQDTSLRKYLVGSWGMNENLGSITYDASKYKNTAYLVGGASWSSEPKIYVIEKNATESNASSNNTLADSVADTYILNDSGNIVYNITYTITPIHDETGYDDFIGDLEPVLSEKNTHMQQVGYNTYDYEMTMVAGFLGSEEETIQSNSQDRSLSSIWSSLKDFIMTIFGTK